jgi:hypothetical protein
MGGWPNTDDATWSPELSPSPSDIVPYSPETTEREVIDLRSSSDDEIPASDDEVLTMDEDSSSDDEAVFDADPVLVMMDERRRQQIYCFHCSILFHWTTEALAHWSSARHARMLAFLHGDPMIYCVVCKLIPDMPHLHEDAPRHQRNLRRLGRAALPTDVRPRYVIVGSDGRRRALIFP